MLSDRNGRRGVCGTSVQDGVGGVGKTVVAFEAIMRLVLQD